MFIPREVGKQCRDGRRDRAGALQRAAQERGPDIAGQGRHHAADGKQHEAKDDHGFAAEAIRCHAERYLQDALGQAIDAEHPAHHGQIEAGQGGRMDREHRQDHEQAQHAQGENRCQR